MHYFFQAQKVLSGHVVVVTWTGIKFVSTAEKEKKKNKMWVSVITDKAVHYSCAATV